MLRTLKYLIANSGVCKVSAISKSGSSAREAASCKDLDRGWQMKDNTGQMQGEEEKGKLERMEYI